MQFRSTWPAQQARIQHIREVIADSGNQPEWLAVERLAGVVRSSPLVGTPEEQVADDLGRLRAAGRADWVARGELILAILARYPLATDDPHHNSYP